VDIQTTILSDYHDTVHHVYQEWEKERHASAERYIYPDAIRMLQHLKICFPNIVIGAITNGRGNPLLMTNTLAKYFDFCVSGEDDSVFPHRKPHPIIYQVALQRCHEILQYRTSSMEETDVSSSWVHVGDDLCNDIAASTACGAKAVWCDLDPEYGQTSSKRLQGIDASWSTASREELDERKAMSRGVCCRTGEPVNGLA
jgi:putative hydrolase of the HAD superfamily